MSVGNLRKPKFQVNKTFVILLLSLVTEKDIYRQSPSSRNLARFDPSLSENFLVKCIKDISLLSAKAYYQYLSIMCYIQNRNTKMYRHKCIIHMPLFSRLDSQQHSVSSSSKVYNSKAWHELYVCRTLLGSKHSRPQYVVFLILYFVQMLVHSTTHLHVLITAKSVGCCLHKSGERNPFSWSSNSFN